MKKPNELFLSRFYDAPVSAVWEAWTDVEQVAQWWGPRGFTLTTHSKDLKVGGTWCYTMHGPDGVDYPNETRYLEVQKHSKLVYDHGAYRDRPPLFRVTVTFSEKDGGTQMDMTMSLATAEAAAEIKKFIKKAGGDSTWDRLAEYLTKQRQHKESFVINRTFEAPIDVLYEAWINPDHLSKWLAPTGFSMKIIRNDIRSGGSSFYSMTADNGSVSLYGHILYVKMKKPYLLIYKQQFCDENEKISRHPMVPVWPETLLTTVQLTAESSNQTRVTVTWEPYGQVQSHEIAAFVNLRASMTQGWTGSFDKLESFLVQNKN